MTRNAYVDLCLTAQAIRRKLEGIRTPLAPALGVAASTYTHQMANVHRVLTDVRVRHLLADEVGLGKTVQALMILNALKYQRRDLQALVIVPDSLVTQWRDEILTRAHSAPMDEDIKPEDGRYIRLAWEAQLRQKTAGGHPKWSLAGIDPDRYDVLVVDELHRLRSDVQDRIVREAASFGHVLVLTATPAFRDLKRHAQLFALLEPERSAMARRRIAPGAPYGPPTDEDDFSQWSDRAAESVVESILGHDRNAAASDSTIGAPTALMHCAYRRVIRTRRSDYGGVLPRRRHIPLLIEPLDAEAERQSLMWRYFSHLADIPLEINRVRLAKRVILSPPSLEQRVDFLRRRGHEREGLLERAKPLVHRSRGDSRADTLVDLLTEIWMQDPHERVLVAAQDNLTVDYLFDLVRARLPEIGPLKHRIPLVASRIRQGMMTEAVDDLGGYGNETAENLEEFQRGEAQILFAPETVQVGLNLQCARILVLYSVPWRPEEVEQWIGRLDRIGNTAAFPIDGEVKTIDIYTIAQKDLVDERVVDVLQRFQAFERSVNLYSAHLEEVSERIEEAALRGTRAHWRDLADATETMAAEDDVRELESNLRPLLPWTVEQAIALRQYMNSIPPAPIALGGSERAASGPRSWDRAMEGMMKLLRRGNEYHIRLNEDPDDGKRFQTLWYRFGEPGMYGHREVRSRVAFSFGADPAHERHPKHAHAFVTRRGDIDASPRRSVTMLVDGVPCGRPLRFLNFGDALHDELVEGWLPDPDRTYLVDVALFDDHAFFEHGDAGVHVLRVSILDPAAALNSHSTEQSARHEVAKAAGEMPPDRLVALMKPLIRTIRCAIEADVRWLRGQFAAELCVDGVKRVEGRWVRFQEEEATLLLNPIAHDRQGVPQASDRPLSEGDDRIVQAVLARLRESDPGLAATVWSNRFPEFDSALEVRRNVVRAEGRDARTLASMELADAESALRSATERGHRALITRYGNMRDQAAALAKMTRAMWDQRDAWLRRCGDAIRTVQPREYIKTVVRVRRDR